MKKANDILLKAIALLLLTAATMKACYEYDSVGAGD